MPTVLQWARHLEARITAQSLYARPFEKRYRGEFVLPFVEREYREVYGPRVDALGATIDPPRTGIAAIGVDALVERLTVTGVESRDDADRPAVLRAERAWEDNDLDVMHREAHREALIKARAFGLVTRGGDGRAIASVEAPEQLGVHRMQAPPYDVDAALKPMVDEWTGQRTARLWVKDREYDLLELAVPIPDPEDPRAEPSQWTVLDDRPAHLRRPPVVEFAVRPRLLAEPESDIAQVASLVDIADLVEALMVFAGHFGAVPIRFATGLPVPRDPKDPTKPLLGPDGRPVMGFDARADRMWTSTDPNTKFGQLEPAGLASFVAWADHVAARIRAKTSIASTYYSVDLKSHMNAELLKTDEAPMVRRILALGRDGTFGQAWRRLLWMMDRTEQPGSQARLRPRWADPETRVEAQATDSFQKLVASGLGVRATAEKVLGWAPDLVERAVAEHEAREQQIALLAEGLDATAGAGGGSAGLVAV